MNLRNFLFAYATLALGCNPTENPPPVPTSNAFSARAGGASCDIGQDIAASAEGHVAVAATFEGTIDFGGGPLESAGSSDIALATWDAEGKPGFSVRFGTASEDGIPRVIAAGGGSWVLTVNTQSTLDLGGGPLVPTGAAGAAIGKLDEKGAHVFSTMIGAPVYGLVADGDGALVATGSFSGTLVLGSDTLTSAGATDVFVTKLDGKGAPVWAKAFGSAALETGMDAAVDPSGNVFLGGGLLAPVDFGGGPATIAGGVDATIVKLDADGNHVFTKTFGDAADQVFPDLAVTPG